jgi:hypothetical protein
MAKIKPYQVAVPEAALTKLKHKLQAVDFPEELEDAGWTYGTPLQVLQSQLQPRMMNSNHYQRKYIKELTSYWLNTYDWGAAEA